MTSIAPADILRHTFNLEQSVNIERIEELKNFYRTALLDDVVPFWMSHGIDREEGGFLTCLERDGTPYSTDKPVWFMGRATWLFATLYRLVEPRDEWRDLARHGSDFLVKNCFDPRGKMYFAVDRTGKPLRMRRYGFSEVFGVLAFAELAGITDDEPLKARALELFDALEHLLTDPNLSEPKINPQTRPMKSLSPTMCMLSVADALTGLDSDPRFERIVSDSIEEVFRNFVRTDDGVVLETVAPDGSRVDAPEGRVMNPGHAIETAWFIMEVGRRRGDMQLVHRAARILDFSLERGWDETEGGLFYFIDVEGKPSPYLEHDMKLWWPHSEGLYATLLAYHLTGDSRYADWFERIHAWTFDHFPDPQHGEWFGYLRRDGSPTTTLKGSMWKGPFHVPRALMLCWRLLTEMASQPPNATC